MKKKRGFKFASIDYNFKPSKAVRKEKRKVCANCGAKKYVKFMQECLGPAGRFSVCSNFEICKNREKIFAKKSINLKNKIQKKGKKIYAK